MNQLISQDALDVLCPMHLALDDSSCIVHAGPTLSKLGIRGGLVGRPILDVFEFKRPRVLAGINDLKRFDHQKLRLKLLDPPHTSFKGVLIKTGEAETEMVINLSFGMSILEGVREFSLTNADFAATDLALELMYLVEAKTAAMQASFRLNSRLQGA